MTRRPETAIRLGIKDLLRKLGWAVWDLEQNRPTRQTPGLPDLIAMHEGRRMVLFIECKTPKGRLSPAQEEFRRIASRSGATYLVWRSVADAWDWLVERHFIEEAAP